MSSSRQFQSSNLHNVVEETFTVFLDLKTNYDYERDTSKITYFRVNPKTKDHKHNILKNL